MNRRTFAASTATASTSPARTTVPRVRIRALGQATQARDPKASVLLPADLMNAHAHYDVLRDAVHIHPTLAEAMQSAVADL